MISGSIRMIAIATEPTNAFNADYLDNWLRPMSLAERDELWSVRATYHAKSEGNAIDTLIQWVLRSEEHTSELQSLMRISYAVFFLKKTNITTTSRQTATATPVTAKPSRKKTPTP